MNKRARSANYDRRLARPIKLCGRHVVKTIKDAADFFAKEFATVTAWGPLEIAIERPIERSNSEEIP